MWSESEGVSFSQKGDEKHNSILSNLEQTGDVVHREQCLEVDRPVSSVDIFLNEVIKCLFY